MVFVPMPSEAAALRSCGLLRADDIPLIAAHWLVEHDGPALRALAASEPDDGWSVDRLWPEAMTELRVVPLGGPGSYKIVLAFYRRAWRAKAISTETATRDLGRYYEQNNYPNWAAEAARCYGGLDELDGGWGRDRNLILGGLEDLLRKDD